MRANLSLPREKEMRDENRESKAGDGAKPASQNPLLIVISAPSGGGKTTLCHQLLAARPDMTRAMLDSLMVHFRDRSLAPIPYRTFPVSRVADAFRHMAKARQIGKIVLRMQDNRVRIKSRPGSERRSLRFEADATCLVTGGLAGFGLATAKWLVEHGVRNLALLSRRGPQSLEAAQEILELGQLAPAFFRWRSTSQTKHNWKRPLPPSAGVSRP